MVGQFCDSENTDWRTSTVEEDSMNEVKYNSKYIFDEGTVL